MNFNMFIIRFTTILLSVSFLAISAGAQEGSSAESTATPPKGAYLSAKDMEKNPLQPADTSSPRDTVEGFLRDMNIALEDVRRGEIFLSSAGYRAFIRALSMLDFSTTPDGNSRVVTNRRILMLKEILDRIALPPESEVPGDDEVAREDLKKWTIPGTSITIQRVEKGPRAG